jgi:hypothetical protein
MNRVPNLGYSELYLIDTCVVDRTMNSYTACMSVVSLFFCRVRLSINERNAYFFIPH